MRKLSAEISPGLPFVIYKEPGTSQIKIIRQKDNRLYEDAGLNNSGFYFYPFDTTEETPVLFPEDKIDIKVKNIRDFSVEPGTLQLGEIDFQEAKLPHINKVKKAVELLKNNPPDLQKIIISTGFQVKLNHFSWEDAVLKLMKTYDESMVWVWYHPQKGLWMGATPELLASYQGGIFETMSLAGTLPVTLDSPVVWTPKEIKEQKLVTGFILKKLKKYTSRIHAGSPKTVFQGKIAHIQTKIRAEIREGEAASLCLSLHPTPAVAGLSVERSKKHIKEIENYKRKYYTGFLGKKSKGQFKFYVNLRTAQINDNQMIIYAGGGVLKDSEPEKEWQEIKNKAAVLYEIITSA